MVRLREASLLLTLPLIASLIYCVFLIEIKIIVLQAVKPNLVVSSKILESFLLKAENLKLFR